MDDDSWASSGVDFGEDYEDDDYDHDYFSDDDDYDSYEDTTTYTDSSDRTSSLASGCTAAEFQRITKEATVALPCATAHSIVRWAVPYAVVPRSVAATTVAPFLLTSLRQSTVGVDAAAKFLAQRAPFSAACSSVPVASPEPRAVHQDPLQPPPQTTSRKGTAGMTRSQRQRMRSRRNKQEKKQEAIDVAEALQRLDAKTTELQATLAAMTAAAPHAKASLRQSSRSPDGAPRSSSNPNDMTAFPALVESLDDDAERFAETSRAIRRGHSHAAGHLEAAVARDDRMPVPADVAATIARKTIRGTVCSGGVTPEVRVRCGLRNPHPAPHAAPAATTNGGARAVNRSKTKKGKGKLSKVKVHRVQEAATTVTEEDLDRAERRVASVLSCARMSTARCPHSARRRKTDRVLTCTLLPATDGRLTDVANRSKDRPFEVVLTATVTSRYGYDDFNGAVSVKTRPTVPEEGDRMIHDEGFHGVGVVTPQTLDYGNIEGDPINAEALKHALGPSHPLCEALSNVGLACFCFALLGHMSSQAAECVRNGDPDALGIPKKYVDSSKRRFDHSFGGSGSTFDTDDTGTESIDTDTIGESVEDSGSGYTGTITDETDSAQSRFDWTWLPHSAIVDLSAAVPAACIPSHVVPRDVALALLQTYLHSGVQQCLEADLNALQDDVMLFTVDRRPKPKAARPTKPKEVEVVALPSVNAPLPSFLRPTLNGGGGDEWTLTTATIAVWNAWKASSMGLAASIRGERYFAPLDPAEGDSVIMNVVLAPSALAGVHPSFEFDDSIHTPTDGLLCDCGCFMETAAGATRHRACPGDAGLAAVRRYVRAVKGTLQIALRSVVIFGGCATNTEFTATVIIVPAEDGRLIGPSPSSSSSGTKAAHRVEIALSLSLIGSGLAVGVDTPLQTAVLEPRGGDSEAYAAVPPLQACPDLRKALGPSHPFCRALTDRGLALLLAAVVASLKDDGMDFFEQFEQSSDAGVDSALCTMCRGRSQCTWCGA